MIRGVYGAWFSTGASRLPVASSCSCRAGAAPALLLLAGPCACAGCAAAMAKFRFRLDLPARDALPSLPNNASVSVSVTSSHLPYLHLQMGLSSPTDRRSTVNRRTNTTQATVHGTLTIVNAVSSGVGSGPFGSGLDLTLCSWPG